MQQPPPYGQQPPFGMPPQDVQPQEDSDKMIAALAYIFCPIVGIIILLTEMKNKPFMKFHAYQSIVFGIALVVLWTVASFLAVVLVGCLIMPVLLVAQFWYAYQAYTKGVFRIPGVTDITYNLFKDSPRPV